MKKIKLNMPLEKATRNRANLVKVMTQVQGRTGQYQAHRWINPNKAMDILKEDLAKQGLKGAKSLEFENPKTGKVLDEKQLLDQMEKEGFKGTLQEYAKQYKIKAKGSKKNIAAKPKAKEKPKAVVETQNTSNQRDFNRLFNKANKIQDADTFVNLYEEAVGDLKDKEDKPINWGAMKRFGTKKILSNGLTQPLNSLSAVEEQAKAFKNEHTDILARNTLDMFGLDIPLYVKRNGKAIQLGRKKVDGFCQYSENGPMEISVVDHADKKQSYETTIHESMHALFVKTFNEEGRQLARVLSNENHEGLVELIGISSARRVYGEEANSLVPSYLNFVAKTALQLRFGGMFDGKGIYDVATEIGEMAAKGDSNGLFEVAENLERFKDIPMERLTNDITYDIVGNPDKLDDKAAKLNKEKNLGEPSELANLVEELKRGTISLSQALNSPQFGPLAALLILEFLEDEDEDFGLIPF